jgi:hypothetical protein
MSNVHKPPVESIIYYEENGLVYWAVGAPVAETTIIKTEDTLEYRLRNGTLPA